MTEGILQKRIKRLSSEIKFMDVKCAWVEIPTILIPFHTKGRRKGDKMAWNGTNEIYSQTHSTELKSIPEIAW